MCVRLFIDLLIIQVMAGIHGLENWSIPSWLGWIRIVSVGFKPRFIWLFRPSVFFHQKSVEPGWFGWFNRVFCPNQSDSYDLGCFSADSFFFCINLGLSLLIWEDIHVRFGTIENEELCEEEREMYIHLFKCTWCIGPLKYRNKIIVWSTVNQMQQKRMRIEDAFVKQIFIMGESQRSIGARDMLLL